MSTNYFQSSFVMIETIIAIKMTKGNDSLSSFYFWGITSLLKKEDIYI